MRAQLRAYTAAVIASTWPDEKPPEGVRYPDTKGMPLTGESPVLGPMIDDVGRSLRHLQPPDPLRQHLQAVCEQQYSDLIKSRWTVILACQAGECRPSTETRPPSSPRPRRAPPPAHFRGGVASSASSSRWATVAVATALGWFAWRAYMATPWTRDGTVRAYVVSIAPQVAGQIVALPVPDNELVHKGDLLMQIDPASYTVAVRQAEAGVAQAKALAQNAEAEWARRLKLNDLAVTLEEQQSYRSKSLSAQAQYQLALVDLDNARLNLRRTRIVAPVNGYVTNLLAQAGDYANVGQRQVSLFDADSFWVDAYFAETFLAAIGDGDAAGVKLMGLSAGSAWVRAGRRARRQRRQRFAVRAGTGASQSDLRLRQARPAGAGAHPP